MANRESTIALSPWRTSIALMETNARIGYYAEKEPCDKLSPEGEPCGGKRVTMMVPKEAIRATEKVTRYRNNDITIYRSVMVTFCERCDGGLPS